MCSSSVSGSHAAAGARRCTQMVLLTHINRERGQRTCDGVLDLSAQALVLPGRASVLLLLQQKQGKWVRGVFACA